MLFNIDVHSSRKKNLLKMNEVKILRCRFRGLSHIISGLILFSAKKVLHIICVKDIQNFAWHTNDFTQKGWSQILQWNFCGPRQIIRGLILLSSEKGIHINCVKEVRNWRKTAHLHNYIFETDNCNNKYHGSAFFEKRTIKKIELNQENQCHCPLKNYCH